jgi:hypothetical protein
MIDSQLTQNNRLNIDDNAEPIAIKEDNVGIGQQGLKKLPSLKI